MSDKGFDKYNLFCEECGSYSCGIFFFLDFLVFLKMDKILHFLGWLMVLGQIYVRLLGKFSKILYWFLFLKFLNWAFSSAHNIEYNFLICHIFRKIWIFTFLNIWKFLKCYIIDYFIKHICTSNFSGVKLMGAIRPLFCKYLQRLIIEIIVTFEWILSSSKVKK